MREDQLTRIEQKLDAIITSLNALFAALGEDEDGQPELTLEGEPAGGERDQSQSL
jgi:hypothetical protein